MSFDPNQLNQIIAKRRSILPKDYSEEKVPDEIIHQMLENANWAPTYGNTEPWRFTVFAGEGLKKLAAFQSELYKKVSSSKGNFNEMTFKKLANNPLKASHVIGIGMKRDPKESIKEIEEIEAVACAVQNMHLLASAYGLAAYWGTGGITYMDGKEEFFQLDPKDRLMGFFYLGKPKNTWPEGKRSSINDKVNWVK